MRRAIFLLLAVLAIATVAHAQEAFDCPTMCEQGAKDALEKCRQIHAKDMGKCPKDDGSIPRECKRLCAEFSTLSPEELQKKLPPNYQDILDGK
ncbi:MAG: hypothetical protein HZA04_04050 [Nitrospinae bacterium]|nr:hypothetical protein [Nitrospinota bacterium]